MPALVLLRVLGPVLALRAALLLLAGAVVLSAAPHAALEGYGDSRTVVHAAESLAEPPESAPADRETPPLEHEPVPADVMEDAAEEVEALPAARAATGGLLRQSDVALVAAQSTQRWLNIETPPPRA